jgi:hypothetical protein
MKAAQQYRRKDFSERDLPNFFRNIYLLEMDMGELTKLYDKYKKQHFSSSKSKD